MNLTPRKSVFITGASAGIGRALAIEYAARGYDLVIAARRQDALEALRSEILALHAGANVHLVALNVTQYENVVAAFKTAMTLFGRLDIVIANAGIGGRGRVGHGHFEKHRAVIETNVLGTMATCEAAIKQFKQQGFGRLVVVSSVAAFRGLPASSAYSAAKTAIATYADSIRAEVYGTPIKITTIYPGYVDTAINQAIDKRPFLITPAKCALLMANKIERGAVTAVIPIFPWILVKWVAPLLPTGTIAKFTRGG